MIWGFKKGVIMSYRVVVEDLGVEKFNNTLDKIEEDVCEIKEALDEIKGLTEIDNAKELIDKLLKKLY